MAHPAAPASDPTTPKSPKSPPPEANVHRDGPPSGGDPLRDVAHRLYQQHLAHEAEKKAKAAQPAAPSTERVTEHWTWRDFDGREREGWTDPDGTRHRRWTDAEIVRERRFLVEDSGYRPEEVCRVSDATIRAFLAAMHDSAEAAPGSAERIAAHARRDAIEMQLHREAATGSPTPPEPSPVGRARQYVRIHCSHPEGPTLRRWRGDWYRWDPARGCYVAQSDEQIERDLYRDLKLTKRAIVGDVRHALIAVDDVLIDHADLGSWLAPPPPQVPEQFRTSAPIVISSDPLDVACAPNGLIDLATGALAPATPRYFATSALGVAYEPNAPEPKRWLEFLRAIWPDDDASILTLQEWMGLMLTPDTRQQKILMLVGPKRSGKGTIARVLTALLGASSVAAPTLASLGTNFGLWPLIGKPAAIISDARLGGRADVSAVVERLLSISGQDPQTIDRKHREPWTGFLPTRITLISNELPRVQDPSGALAGRMVILELSRSWYGQEDTGLTDALLGELPGILLWAIEGWRSLRARGRLVQPDSSAALTDELADLGSPVRAWLRDRTVEVAEPKSYVLVDTAYRDYCSWARDNGHHEPSKETFGRDLHAAGHGQSKRRRDDGKLDRVYKGLALATSVRAAAPPDFLARFRAPTVH